MCPQDFAIDKEMPFSILKKIPLVSFGKVPSKCCAPPQVWDASYVPEWKDSFWDKDSRLVRHILISQHVYSAHLLCSSCHHQIMSWAKKLPLHNTVVEKTKSSENLGLAQVVLEERKWWLVKNSSSFIIHKIYVTWLSPMFVLGPNRKELENKGVSFICLHRWAVLEMVAPICSFWHTAIYVSKLVCPCQFPSGKSRILFAIGQTLWSKVPSAIPKTIRPSSCVIQLWAARNKSSILSSRTTWASPWKSEQVKLYTV